MKQKSKFTTFIAVLCLLLASAGAALLYLCGKNHFDAGLGYFNPGSGIVTALYGVLALGIIAGILIWLESKPNASAVRALPSSICTPAFSVLCGAAVLYFTVTDLLYVTATAADEYIIVTYISWVLAIPCAAWLLLSAGDSGAGREPRVLQCFLGFFPPLYFASLVLVDYFDRTVAVNSPVKVIFQITFISFMLMFTAEAGLSLGRGTIFPRYQFILCCAAVFGGTLGIGGLILYAVSCPFPVSLKTSVLCIAGTVYALGRLFAAASQETVPRSALPAKRVEEVKEPEEKAEE